MQKYVITISRQFGSLGRPIAQKLSERLGVEYLDRDIVEETAKRMNLPVSIISDEEENLKVNKFFKSLYPLGLGLPSLKNEIFNVQKNIILDLIKKDSCIIVGRCAELFAKNEKNHLNVYIYAPYEKRLENCIKRLDMNEKTARTMIKEVDLSRMNYHKLYVPGYTSPFDNRDLCLDSSAFGIEGTAEIIENIVKMRFK
ncbi:MAG: cytidylate kinase-like family protein [Treponema sp.]|nr:cytidylate kinase-like family protein [Treponema sp.]